MKFLFGFIKFTRMNLVAKALYAVGAVTLLVVFWHSLVIFGGVNRALLPLPLEVYNALTDLARDGQLFSHIIISLSRLSVGYSLAVFAGLVLGLIAGQIDFLAKLIDPLAQLIRPVAPVAWLPFVVLFLGIGDAPAVFVIFMAAFFPVLLPTMNASRKVDEKYMKIARTFEMRHRQVFFKIIIPAIFPHIVNGMHLGLGSAWIFLVAGEMIGVRSGLGFLIMDARNNMRPDILLATICIIALLGLILDKLITIFETQINKIWGA